MQMRLNTAWRASCTLEVRTPRPASCLATRAALHRAQMAYVIIYYDTRSHQQNKERNVSLSPLSLLLHSNIYLQSTPTPTGLAHFLAHFLTLPSYQTSTAPYSHTPRPAQNLNSPSHSTSARAPRTYPPSPVASPK